MSASVDTRTEVSQVLSDRIAGLVADTDLSSLPDEVVEYSKRLILDTVACTVGGNVLETRHEALKGAALATAGPGRSTILVSGERVDPVTAAMVNSEAGGVLAASDSFYFSHAATLIFANALAVTEAQRGSGADLLTAFVTGLETASVLNILSPSNLPPGQVGASQRSQTDRLRSAGGRLNYVAVGGAAAAARALGLDAGRTAHALTAAAMTAPTRVTPPRSRWSSVNYIAYYPQAQTSIMAALLAERGFTGEPDVLEELLDSPVTEDLLRADQEWVLAQLGERWWVLDDCVKRYPSCRYLGGPLQLFEEIREREALRPEEIDAVRVRVSPLVMNFGPIADASYELDASKADTALDVPFNTPYLISMLAHCYPTGPEWFRPQHFTEPSVNRLMQRVRLELDEAAGPDLREKAQRAPHHRVAETGATGIVVEARGTTFEASCGHIKGDPFTPETRVTDEFLVEKMRNYADSFLPASRADEIVSAVLSLEDMDDASELTRLATRSDRTATRAGAAC
jgi:2-methylcitrate dehydratase PrpD